MARTNTALLLFTSQRPILSCGSTCSGHSGHTMVHPTEKRRIAWLCSHRHRYRSAPVLFVQPLDSLHDYFLCLILQQLARQVSVAIDLGLGSLKRLKPVRGITTTILLRPLCRSLDKASPAPMSDISITWCEPRSTLLTYYNRQIYLVSKEGCKAVLRG